MPFTLVRLYGDELELPEVISLTMVVPELVPSDFQSSIPLVALFAVKKSVSFAWVRFCGLELELPA